MTTIKRAGTNYTTLPDLVNELITKDLWNYGLDNNSVTGTTIPAVNIRETDDSFLVEMAAPGLKKEDFKIELSGNTLTITSDKNQEELNKADERFVKREFSYQSFNRVFTLSKDVVDSEGIQARYQNGVLELVIPKKEEAKKKGPRTIQIA